MCKATSQGRRSNLSAFEHCSWKGCHGSCPANPSLSFQRDIEVIAWHTDAATAADLGSAIELRIAVWQGAVHRRRDPQAQQMPLPVHLLHMASAVRHIASGHA